MDVDGYGYVFVYVYVYMYVYIYIDRCTHTFYYAFLQGTRPADASFKNRRNFWLCLERVPCQDSRHEPSFLHDDLTEPILHARLSGEQNQLETGVGLSETERGGDPATQQPVTTCRYNPEDIWAERRQGKSGHATEARSSESTKGTTGTTDATYLLC